MTGEVAQMRAGIWHRKTRTPHRCIQRQHRRVGSVSIGRASCDGGPPPHSPFASMVHPHRRTSDDLGVIIGKRNEELDLPLMKDTTVTWRSDTDLLPQLASGPSARDCIPSLRLRRAPVMVERARASCRMCIEAERKQREVMRKSEGRSAA